MINGLGVTSQKYFFHQNWHIKMFSFVTHRLCAFAFISVNEKMPIDPKYAFISISAAENPHKLWFYELIAVLCVDAAATNQKWSTCGWWNWKNVLLSISRPGKSLPNYPQLSLSSTCGTQSKFFPQLVSALNAYRMDGFDLSLLIISPRFCLVQQKKCILCFL